VTAGQLVWTGDDTFMVDRVEYVCRPLRDRFPSTAERMCLVKAPWQVEWYAQLLRTVAPQSMVEVGMWEGASFALAAQLVSPRRLVGIDSRATPSRALDDFIVRADLQQRVRPYYGIDQTDTARLADVVEAEFGAEPLDLVVDDASHLLDPTRTTFHALFPRLRPSGRYVIEDWAMHRWVELEAPLTLLVLELMLACEEAPNVVANVEVQQGYAIVTRGNASLSLREFDLGSCYGDGARFLLARAAGENSR
jgi:hypothetical protein